MIKENVSLKPFNTFDVKVSAKYFAEIQTIEELIDVLIYANTHQLQFLFLGGGSNILLTKDFDGVAIQVNLRGISEEIINDNEVIITSKAGENWHQFVQYCLDRDYGGLENLSLIPGNVGTSPMQNIGAYGTEIKDTFESCKVLNLEKLKDKNNYNDAIEVFDKTKCRFGYRDSIFKREGKDKYIILEVSFRLTRNHHQIKTEYGAIKTELDNLGVSNPTIQDISKAVINIRQSKLPDPQEIGNAGSFFKNPTIPLIQFEVLQKEFDNIPGYANGDIVKVPAGWLIEQCGWKGKQIGNVATHHLQSLVIVNKTGLASGQEIFDFSTMIINSVKEKFGITLEREVNIL